MKVEELLILDVDIGEDEHDGDGGIEVLLKDDGDRALPEFELFRVRLFLNVAPEFILTFAKDLLESDFLIR